MAVVELQYTRQERSRSHSSLSDEGHPPSSSRPAAAAAAVPRGLLPGPGVRKVPPSLPPPPAWGAPAMAGGGCCGTLFCCYIL